MPNRKCTVCGKEAVRELTVPMVVEHNGQKRTISDRRMVCSNCENVSYGGDQISQNHLAVAAAIRDIDGLLSAAELASIRAKYKLRQSDLEQMFSTGPKTWTRWERGKVPQSKSTDKLIRLMADDPQIAYRLMQQSGVVNSEASMIFEKIANTAALIAERSFAAAWGTEKKFTTGFVKEAFETIDQARKQAAASVEARAA